MNRFFATIILLILSCVEIISCGNKLSRVPRAYYISADGNDDGRGGPDDPWQSIEKVNRVHPQSGDSVLFEGGKIFRGRLLIDSNSLGTEQFPILIGSYGNGHAKIDGGNGNALVLYLTRHIMVKNLDLLGNGRKKGNIKDGLALLNSDFINVDSFDISGFQKSGMLIYSSKEVAVSNVLTHANGYAGITVEGNNR